MKTRLLSVVLLLAGALASACTSSKAAATGSLHHVGLVWLKEPGSEADRQRLIDAAHAFLREIPEVRRLSVGQAVPRASPLLDSSFDLCLVMEFDDQAALDRYAQHPVHLKAAQEAFLPLARKLLFYDFVAE
jgi:stress responsive alpha/beta barrel protein